MTAFSWLFDHPAVPAFVAAVAGLGALWVSVLQRFTTNRIARATFVNEFNKALFDFTDVRVLILSDPKKSDLSDYEIVRIFNYAVMFETIEHNVANKIISDSEFQKGFGARFEEFWNFLHLRADLLCRSDFRDVKDGLELLNKLQNRVKSRG